MTSYVVGDLAAHVGHTLVVLGEQQCLRRGIAGKQAIVCTDCMRLLVAEAAPTPPQQQKQTSVLPGGQQDNKSGQNNPQRDQQRQQNTTQHQQQQNNQPKHQQPTVITIDSAPVVDPKRQHQDQRPKPKTDDPYSFESYLRGDR